MRSSLLADRSLWLIDDRPLADLHTLLPHHGIWPADALYVTDAVARASLHDRSGHRPELLDARSGDGPAFTVLQVRLEGEAFDLLYGHLRGDLASTTADLAEHEDITLCATLRPDLTFVTQDARAAWLATTELGHGRVACPFNLWLDLHRRRCISTDALTALYSRATRGDARLARAPWRARWHPWKPHT